MSSYNTVTTSTGSIDINYFSDMLIYDRSMDVTERTAIDDFFKTEHSGLNPDNGDTISNFALSGITNEQDLTGGVDYVNVTYDSIGTPSRLVAIWMYNSTIKGISSSDNPYSILVPSSSDVIGANNVKIYSLDSNGIASNVLSNDTIKFNVI
jgi:hypothetical protein